MEPSEPPDSPLEPEPTPRPSFSTLPVELKRRIAIMARDQDAAYRARVPRPEAEDSDEEDEYNIYGDPYREGHSDSSREDGRLKKKVGKWNNKSRSLRALRAVDKTMSEVCTPLVFQSLKLRQADADLFKLNITFAYGHHFHHLVVRTPHLMAPSTASDTLVSTITLLRSTPTITSLHVITSGGFFGSLMFELDRFVLPFMSLGPRIRSLRLDDDVPGSVARFLSYFPNLTDLHLSGHDLFPSGHAQDNDVEEAEADTDRQDLADRIAGLAHLERVHLQTMVGGTTGLKLGDLWEREWSSMATLRHVALLTSVFDVSLVKFIDKLAPKLESLHLDFDEVEEESQLAFSNLSPCPLLTTLEMDGGIADIALILSALTHSPLRHLFLTLSLTSTHTRSDSRPSSSLVAQLLAQLKPNGLLHSLLTARQSPLRTLVSFHLGQNFICWEHDQLPPSHSLALNLLAKELGATSSARGEGSEELLQKSGRRDAFREGVDAMWDQEQRDVELGLAGETVEKVLEFGKGLVKRSVEANDRVGLQRVVEVLRPLKELYEDERD